MRRYLRRLVSSGGLNHDTCAPLLGHTVAPLRSRWVMVQASASDVVGRDGAHDFRGQKNATVHALIGIAWSLVACGPTEAI